MSSPISWQRGFYESGRSKTHFTDDGIKTLCGLIIPDESNDIEIMGDDGIGTCKKCEPKAWSIEIPIRRGFVRPIKFH